MPLYFAHLKESNSDEAWAIWNYEGQQAGLSLSQNTPRSYNYIYHVVNPRNLSSNGMGLFCLSPLHRDPGDPPPLAPRWAGRKWAAEAVASAGPQRSRRNCGIQWFWSSGAFLKQGYPVERPMLFSDGPWSKPSSYGGYSHFWKPLIIWV